MFGEEQLTSLADALRQRTRCGVHVGTRHIPVGICCVSLLFVAPRWCVSFGVPMVPFALKGANVGAGAACAQRFVTDYCLLAECANKWLGGL
eukprot:1990728-Prymnesium_polylepis.1